MAITADNSLSGPGGAAVTTASLAARGTPPAALLDPETLLYDAAHTVHGLTMIRARTGYRRGDTGRIAWTLPGGAWAVRIYVHAPYLRPTVDILERRHLLDLGTHAVVLRESTGRNALLRLQPTDLAAADSAGVETGSAVAIDQLERVEVMYDGAGTLTGRIYAGDATTGYRQNQWSQTISAATATWSGYRWFKYTTLQIGSTDANSGGQVSVYQQQLLDLGYELPLWGADGDYGAEAAAATAELQTDYGLTPVDGIAGPETRSTVELAHTRLTDTGYFPPPVWFGEVAVSDTAAPIGPAGSPGGTAAAGMAASGAVVGHKIGFGATAATVGLTASADGHRGGPAPGLLGLGGTATGSKSSRGTASAGVALTGTASGTKATSGLVLGGLALTGTVQGYKSSSGTASAALAVTGRVEQLVLPVPALAALATPVGQLAADATPVGQLAGAAYRPDRLGGTAERR